MNFHAATLFLLFCGIHAPVPVMHALMRLEPHWGEAARPTCLIKPWVSPAMKPWNQ